MGTPLLANRCIDKYRSQDNNGCLSQLNSDSSLHLRSHQKKYIWSRRSCRYYFPAIDNQGCDCYIYAVDILHTVPNENMLEKIDMQSTQSKAKVIKQRI